MALLSVIVITKNEEKNIKECLESARWADEIIVADGGSTDRTVELAKQFTPKVLNRPWDGYGAAKNFALSHCTGTWILWLDADERVTPELAIEIQAIIRSETIKNGYEVARRAYFLGRWMKHSGWYPGYVLRLFRRESGKFTENKVHEWLELEGETGRLSNDLLHFTDPNIFHYFEKFNRYTTLAAEELVEEGGKYHLGQLLSKPLWAFIRMYVVRRGFMDGIQGFILAVLSSCYVFTKYAKFWELSHFIQRS